MQYINIPRFFGGFVLLYLRFWTNIIVIYRWFSSINESSSLRVTAAKRTYKSLPFIITICIYQCTHTHTHGLVHTYGYYVKSSVLHHALLYFLFLSPARINKYIQYTRIIFVRVGIYFFIWEKNMSSLIGQLSRSLHSSLSSYGYAVEGDGKYSVKVHRYFRYIFHIWFLYYCINNTIITEVLQVYSIVDHLPES